MGKIIEEIEARDLSELIKVLQKFPADMNFRMGCDDRAIVSHVIPQEDECVEDKRGYLLIEGTN